MNRTIISGLLELTSVAYGVWVGEHGLLIAVFAFKEDAEKWAADATNVNPPDYSVNPIELHNELGAA